MGSPLGHRAAFIPLGEGSLEIGKNVACAGIVDYYLAVVTFQADIQQAFYQVAKPGLVGILILLKPVSDAEAAALGEPDGIKVKVNPV